MALPFTEFTARGRPQLVTAQEGNRRSTLGGTSYSTVEFGGFQELEGG